MLVGGGGGGGHVVSPEDDQEEGHSLGMIKRPSGSFTLFFFSSASEWSDLLPRVLYVCTRDKRTH